TLDKRGQKREVSLGQGKKTREVSIRVDQGMIYAVVTNEKKEFDRDDTVREAYLIEKQGIGYTVDPKKELKISMSGDSQDSTESEVKLIGYRQDYKDKLFEEVVRLGNGKSKSWTFSPEKNIRTIEVLVDKTGGVKFRMEQPAPVPKIVRTQPIKKKQTPTEKTEKTFGAALSKADAKVISLAFFKNDIKTVKAYFEKGMDANITLNGAPLLQNAARESSVEMVKLIVAQGGDLTYRAKNGQDVLFQAISNTGYWNEVIPVLVEAGVEVNEKTSIYKITQKVQNGRFKPGVKDTLELLLSKGADINYPTSTSGSTHLMFAAKMAWLEPVEFYLAHGADMNAKTKKGETALSLAKTKRKGEQPYEEENRTVIIELLKSKGAR
ncbi:MAG: ankyrin repeat domain-containing protein, partial [Desulfobacterales bacterium]|nr:ankyrin repeat domain-containing protein [Desulfobacterales bacterium]